MINFVRILTFIVALVITIFSIFYIDAEQEFAMAQKAYRSGDMDQTLRMARRANRAFSETNKKVDTYYLQARAASKMNWNKKSKVYLDRLLNIDDENINGLLFRGEILHQLDKNQMALIDLNKGLSLASGNSSNKTLAYYHTQRGLAFLSLNQINEANEDALEAIKFEVGLPAAHDLMSKVFEEKGDLKNALEECEKAYELSQEKDKLSFMTPEGRKLSDRVVDIKGKYLLSK